MLSYWERTKRALNILNKTTLQRLQSQKNSASLEREKEKERERRLERRLKRGERRGGGRKGEEKERGERNYLILVTIKGVN